MGCDCDYKLCNCEGDQYSSKCVFIEVDEKLQSIDVNSGISLSDALNKIDSVILSLNQSMEEFTAESIFTLITENTTTKQIDVNGRINVKDGSATPKKGDFRFNATTNKHQGYNGTTWNDCY